MQDRSIYLTLQQVPAVLLRAFPEYRGGKFRAQPATEVALTGCAWSGGSRDQYVAVELESGRTAPADPELGNPFSLVARGEKLVQLPAGVAIVQHTIFMGKDMGLTFHVRPENLAPLLPAAPEVSYDQAVVLEFTCALKASYEGKSRRDRAVERGKITGERWDAAKAECIAKGWLNRAGAVTPSGRNVRSASPHKINVHY